MTDDTQFTDIIILAGGFGERLWPASRPDYPKQFMALEGGISFLQAAVQRALFLKPKGKIIVITRRDLLQPVSEHCAHLMDACNNEERKKLFEDLSIIAEPCPRHTCAPVMLACIVLELFDKAAGEVQQPNSEHTILVLASDHVIGPKEIFISDCKKAARIAQRENFVCFAIQPTEASTSYGYIKQGNSFDGDDFAFYIAQFKEKPDLETAQQYIASKQYFWNSGMFAFTNTFFKNELKLCEPDVYGAFLPFAGAHLPEQRTMNGIKYIADWSPLQEAYTNVPAIAIDTAIAEKTKRAVAIKASFGWDDVGSWDSFEKLFTENTGKTVEIQSTNNFVYSDIPVALCGVENLVVVIKNGNALIMKKGSSQMMRQVVQQMK